LRTEQIRKDWKGFFMTKNEGSHYENPRRIDMKQTKPQDRIGEGGKVLAVTGEQIETLHGVKIEFEKLFSKMESLAKIATEGALAAGEGNESTLSVYWPSVFEMFLDLTGQGSAFIEEMDGKLCEIEKGGAEWQQKR
jgi:hypothetical protein